MKISGFKWLSTGNNYVVTNRTTWSLLFFNLNSYYLFFFFFNKQSITWKYVPLFFQIETKNKNALNQIYSIKSVAFAYHMKPTTA